MQKNGNALEELKKAAKLYPDYTQDIDLKKISNGYLRKAYDMIRELYQTNELTPARLKKIGFRNKWNSMI
ncbi:hypothetical protein [Desulfosporosinus sp. FKA]|uniref:hypothetical protein n=1 Tax=Desulfosporosinus sp. FKA TaxID=1969834 RepID=UPI000B49D060|nr:hypothetical protein [Desulfosporosinus sp. FKA]